ncbi:MAG: glycoside hydrolase family 27 protein [Clostridiales bacterium]|nr:glycoside hydrolase family 27 protein [Clostridiales bacterium]
MVLNDFKKYAEVPPMGWNSWDCYANAVNEEQLLSAAGYIAENLAEYGWEYIVCDIQWSEPYPSPDGYKSFTELCMDGYSRLIPAETRFPSCANGAGFKPIADKIHSLGLKFGIHIMRGIPRQAVHAGTPILADGKTARDIAADYSLCPWNNDMYGVDCTKDGAQEYYNSLFRLYASWGVDFVKCDDISNTEFRPDRPYSAEKEIEAIRRAIDLCGRKMVLSLSPGPAPVENAPHLLKNANMWRMSGDFWDNWEQLYNMFELCKKWEGCSDLGCWPDCDMIPFGNLFTFGKRSKEEEDANIPRRRQSRFTRDEQVTLMTLWCIFRSPLMLGGVPESLDGFTLSLLKNKELIEMQKHSYGARECYRKRNGDIAWTACGENCRYLALFNTSPTGKAIRFDLSDITMPGAEYSVLDMWSGEVFSSTDAITARINAHGARAFRITLK